MRSIRPIHFLLAILAITFLAYWPGLSGTFVFDDIANITGNTYIAITNLDVVSLKDAAFSIASGPLGRPVSMVSFAVNYYAAGLNPYYFKLTNLVIHLCNGVGVYVLTSLLLNFYRKRFEPDLSAASLQWTVLAVTSAWLLHPFNLTSVLYVVQRMTSLSAFFSIWGLVFFIWGRTRLYEGRSGVLPILVSLFLCAPLAIFSKENGSLLPVFMLIAEFTLFTFDAEKLNARRFLIGFYTFSVVIPIIVALTYVALNPDWLLAGYANRGFTLYERLMTETRVLCYYLRQIILPDTTLMGLYLDDIPISRGLLRPVSTLLSVSFIAVLVGLALVLRRGSPLVAFGILFFFVGHALESTIYPLDIAYEHRNYLPMYGVVLVMFFYLLHPSFHVRSLQLRRAASIVLILIFAFGTFLRASSWANPRDFAQAEFNHHPNSVRANIELGYVYDSFVPITSEGREEYYQLARQRYERAAQLDKNDIGGLAGLIVSSARRGKRVERKWVEELAFRLEYAPYAAVTSDKLLNLTICHLKGECKLQSTWVGDLLGAALRNSALSGHSRAKILYAKSSYLINVMHDYPAATEAMYQMVESVPSELATRFALIEFLMAMQHFDKADAEIKKSSLLDMNGSDRKRLMQLDRQLMDITGKTTSAIK